MRHPWQQSTQKQVSILVSCSVLASGCITGSLASDTGPSPPGTFWSDAARQMVHVGEQVRFDFVLQDALRRRVLPMGLADYSVVFVDGKRIETQAGVALAGRDAVSRARRRPGAAGRPE